MRAILLTLAFVGQNPGTVQLVIEGRENRVVSQSQQIFTGLCDDKKVSATLTKQMRNQQGSLTLQAGAVSARIPDSFLGGRLVKSSFYAAALACDGRRVMFRARVALIDAEGSVAVHVQSATLDMKTGQLELSPVRVLPPEEVRLELRGGG